MNSKVCVAQRRFIRLEEINEKTNLTKGDILDAVDSGQLTFSALVEAQNLGALIKGGESLKVAAVFDFNGMVSLGGNVSKQFALHSQPNQVNHLAVLQPEKISNWRSVSNAFGNVEETDLEYLANAPNQPDRPFAAYAGLEIIPTMNNKVGNIANTYTNLLSAFVDDSKLLDEFKHKYPKTDSMRLQTKSIKVESQRLRLDLEDIAKVFGPDSVKSVDLTGNLTVSSTIESVSQTSKNKVSNTILTHPIELIVERVLSVNPQTRADKVWNLIRRDINLEANRQYDIDSVITEITSEDIHWFGKGDTEHRMGYESFRRNTVAKVRKHIKSQQ